MKDIAALFKLRLGFFVVMSAILGWFMAVESLDLKSFLLLSIGGYLLTGASNGFNQVIEKRVDGLMDRTAERPLPSGRMNLRQAIFYSALAGIIGLGCLFALNTLSGCLGIAALVTYAFIYTPLKSRSTLSVFVGAFPGALPPMIGYVAASGDFGIEPGTLFAVQFMWQFPHFWAIAWLAHDDYRKAGYYMLPFRAGRTKESAWQILMYTAFCIPTSLLPWALPSGSPMVGNTALVVAIVCGIGFIIPAFKLYRTLDRKHARQLMFASLAYLPMVHIAYIFDKI